MPITLNTFNTSVTPPTGEVHMIWKEAYTTAGVNQRDIGTRPLGTYRGFRLAPGSVALQLLITPDPVQLDSVATIIDPSGQYAIGVHRTTGTTGQAQGVTAVDLTPEAGNTVYICLYVAYTPGTSTDAEIRAYTLAEFATAPEAPYVVVLGQVVVPASGVIPAANITYTGRIESWSTKAPESNQWTPLLVNGGFDRGPTGNIPQYNLPNAVGSFNNFQIPSWQYHNTHTTPTGVLSLETTDVNPSPGPNLFAGSQALQWQYGTSSEIWTLTQYIGARINPGQLVYYSYWIKAPQGPPVSGVFLLVFRWYNASGTNTATFGNPVIPSSSYSSSEWVQVSGYLTAPSDAASLPYVYIEADNVAFTTHNSPAIRIDDFQIYLETNSALAPNSNRDLRLTDQAPGDLILQDVLTVPSSDSSTSAAAGVLRFDSTSLYAPTVGQLVFQRRDQSDTPSTLPHVVPNSSTLSPTFQVLGQMLLGLGHLDSDATTDIARLEIPTSSAYQMTLVEESIPNPTLGGGARRYVGNAGGIWITQNAYWTNSTGLWQADITTSPAYGIHIGGSVGGVLIYVQQVTTGTWNSSVGAGGWTFTQTLTDSSGNAIVYGDLSVGGVSSDLAFTSDSLVLRWPDIKLAVTGSGDSADLVITNVNDASNNYVQVAAKGVVTLGAYDGGSAGTGSLTLTPPLNSSGGGFGTIAIDGTVNTLRSTNQRANDGAGNPSFSWINSTQIATSTPLVDFETYVPVLTYAAPVLQVMGDGLLHQNAYGYYWGRAPLVPLQFTQSSLSNGGTAPSWFQFTTGQTYFTNSPPDQSVQLAFYAQPAILMPVATHYNAHLVGLPPYNPDFNVDPMVQYQPIPLDDAWTNNGNNTTIDVQLHILYNGQDGPIFGAWATILYHDGFEPFFPFHSTQSLIQNPPTIFNSGIQGLATTAYTPQSYTTDNSNYTAEYVIDMSGLPIASGFINAGLGAMLQVSVFRDDYAGGNDAYILGVWVEYQKTFTSS